MLIIGVREHDPASAMPRTTTVANYLIRAAKRRGLSLTPLSLQKLLYYVHGHAHARLGRGAVDEPFEAWQYGPVVRSLYRHLRDPAARQVSEPIPEFAPEDLELSDPEVARVAERVLDTYGTLDGYQLVTMTHAADGPWAQVYRNGGHHLGDEIPDRLIAEYFRERDRAA